ncbi:MAG TPA: formyltransferase family protein [Bradyrhizobium sp.]|nr:formyltransferase family protein [Bradyrhizobium sp.]
MLKTIILLTATVHQQRALGRLLSIHNPALAFRAACTFDELAAIEPHVLRDARLIAFTSGVIVPRFFLEALGHGAYNFHPGPPHYPGWAPAHFALYDGATTFGATMHVMVPRVDSGPITGVESFVIPEGASVRDLEQIAYIRLGHLFWRKARELACSSEPLKRLPIAWSGVKSTRRMYRDLCALPCEIDAGELKRGIRAFDDDFRGIPFTITQEGVCYRLDVAALRNCLTEQVEAPPLAVA